MLRRLLNLVPIKHANVSFNYADAAVTPNVGVLSGGPNASISYFVKPYVAAQGMECLTVDVTSNNETDAAYHTIVIVRYLPDGCITGLRDFKRNGGKLVYFMDDDLMDASALETMPDKYVKRIKSTALAKRRVIEELCSEFWVSSAYLMSKYAAWRPILLRPTGVGESLVGASRKFSICYHGTASHQTEIEWLVPLVSELQRRSSNAVFELFGDHGVNKVYRGIPGVAVLHPMSWPNYLAYTNATQRDIALAPLLPTKFNAARGPTKFFDFARMNAVGLYSKVSPYDGFIRDGIDGVLLPNEREAWVEAITSLLHDPEKRDWMASNARKRVRDIT